MITLLLFCVGFYYTIVSAANFMNDLAYGAPIVTADFVLIAVLPLGLVFVILIFVVIAAAIPLSDRLLKKLRAWMSSLILWIPLACWVLMFPAQYVLPYYLMPKLGYTPCKFKTGLSRSNIVYWIKNPAWCVKGKDRKWVLEQAAARAAPAPSEPAAAPAKSH